MGNQRTHVMAEDHGSGFARCAKLMRWDEFLKAMDTLVPWATLYEEIEPHYPMVGNGRPPVGLEQMLRMHFVQHWFILANQTCEETLYDSTNLQFRGHRLESRAGATTLLHFRRLLDRTKSKARAKVKYVFAVVKRQWGFPRSATAVLRRTRRGCSGALALANLYMIRPRYAG